MTLVAVTVPHVCPRVLGALLAGLLTLAVVPGAAAATPSGAAVGGAAVSITSAPVAPGPFDVIVADVTGDGRNDVVTASNGSKYVSVLAGRGDGSIDPRRNWPISDAATAVAAGDVDGDGLVDLIVLHYGSTQAPAVDVLRGLGGGRFDAPVVTPAPNGGAMTVGDLDGDGRTDVVVDDGFSASLRIMLGQAGGGLTTLPLLPVARHPVAVALGDLDADGDLDLVTTSNYFSTGTLSVLTGDGTGSFQSGPDQPAGASPIRIELGDVDLDGDLDALLLDAGRPFPPYAAPQLLTLPGVGHGALGAPIASAVPRQRFIDLGLGDVDGDGRPDAVLPLGPSGGVLAVLRGAGTGTFGARVLITYGPTNVTCCQAHVALGDLDGDGRPEIALTDYETNRATVVRQTSA